MDNPPGPAPAPDAYLPAGLRTPLRDDAFAHDDEAKITAISGHFEAIMRELGLDLTDDSLAGTPRRVAKMYVQEWFKGLDPKNRPEVRMFDNRYDHRNLNLDVDDFRALNPTVEHLAVAIWQRLRPHLAAELALSVTLYETDRNFVEYHG